MSSPKKPRNPDHVRPRRAPSPDNEAIAAHLQDLLTPRLYSQYGLRPRWPIAYYRTLGLRERILTLPLMLAAVLTLLWRQVPSVHELTRMLAQEDLLWAQAATVSQQALSKRFLTFPAELFARVVQDLLPVLTQRQRGRKNRPRAASIQWATRHFMRIWAVDGSTLEALFRKLDSLQTQPVGTLAGKIGTVLDMVSHLPVQIWFDENSQAHDTCFGERLCALVPAGTLLVLDRGFYDFTQLAQLMAQKAHFVTRLKKNTRYQVLQTLSMSDGHQDQLILLTGREAPLLTLRLVMIRQDQTWYSWS
ncbi:transposase [Anthocerotibacter panamensis]|uniref:transposase n=1 Tax=Anthocerotibacter panamensis TaxID=2857077 RepID=UPI001C402DE1|nr:transposase [Anthocerotibacter panamensis]